MYSVSFRGTAADFQCLSLCSVCRVPSLLWWPHCQAHWPGAARARARWAHITFWGKPENKDLTQMNILEPTGEWEVFILFGRVLTIFPLSAYIKIPPTFENSSWDFCLHFYHKNYKQAHSQQRANTRWDVLPWWPKEDASCPAPQFSRPWPEPPFLRDPSPQRAAPRQQHGWYITQPHQHQWHRNHLHVKFTD